jgi:predicted HTH domain antitoxin
MPAVAPHSERTELPPFVDSTEGRLMMAMKFYEVGRLSLGQSAELAGYSKASFIDVLGRYGVPVLNSNPAELASELVW